MSTETTQAPALLPPLGPHLNHRLDDGFLDIKIEQDRDAGLRDIQVAITFTHHYTGITYTWSGKVIGIRNSINYVFHAPTIQPGDAFTRGRIPSELIVFTGQTAFGENQRFCLKKQPPQSVEGLVANLQAENDALRAKLASIQTMLREACALVTIDTSQ